MDALIKIKCIRGNLEGKSWEYIDKNQVIKIGRNKDSDILIPAEDATVSRKQCEIRISDGKIVLIDGDGKRKSTQGTWVDNKKIREEYPLEGEHQLGIGVAGNAEMFEICVQQNLSNINGKAEEAECETVDATIVGQKEIEDNVEVHNEDKKEEKENVQEENLGEEKRNNQRDIEAEPISDNSVSTLEEAYPILDTFLKEESEEKQKEKRERYIAKRAMEKNSVGKISIEEAYEKLEKFIKKPEKDSSIVVNMDDYDDAIKENENIKIDNIVVVDKEEEEIEHHVKLKKIDIGWNGEYKKMGKEKTGGFGSVIKLQNQKTKKRFALKTLQRKDLWSIKWFKREVLIGQQLEHQNLIKVYEAEFDEKNKNYRYLMEYCEGGDLQSYLKPYSDRKKGIKIEDAVTIMYQILDALNYLHNAKVICFDKNGNARKVQGLVHRDIKPGNIFFKRANDISSVAIGDYGTLKSVELAGESGGTSDGIRMGQDGYKPIKLTEGKGKYRYAQQGVDVFSAAAIFYFMLTGNEIRREKDKSISVRGKKNIPPKLAEVIDNVLKEDNIIEEELITTAKEFKNQIKEAMETR